MNEKRLMATYPAIQHHQDLKSKDVHIVPRNPYSTRARGATRYMMTHLTGHPRIWGSVLIITRWGLLELVKRGSTHRAVSANVVSDWRKCKSSAEK